MSTVGEVLRTAERGRKSQVCVRLHDVGVATALPLLKARPWASGITPDDLADEMLVRAMQRGFKALREAQAATPLVAWVRGVLLNILRETAKDAAHQEAAKEGIRNQRRETAKDVAHDWETVVPESTEDLDSPPEPSLAGWSDLSLEALTAQQSQVLVLRLEGLSYRTIGSRLGLTADAVRSRIRRATTSRVRGPPDHRAWARAMLRQVAPNERRTTLEWYAGGLSLREIAARTGSTENAVKLRLRRLRKVLRDPPRPPAPLDDRGIETDAI